MSNFTRPIDYNLILTNVTNDKIDEIILTGKHARFWVIQDFLGNYFGGKDMNFTVGDSPDIVAYDAAVKGAMLAAESMKQSRMQEL